MTAVCTLQTARRGLSRRVGYFLASRATSGSTTSIQDFRSPIRSSNDQSDLLIGKWILRPSAPEDDRLRIVAENGYNPTQGVIQPDNDWTSPVQPGEVYELHGSLEPWDDALDIFNAALLRCYTITEFAVAATQGVTRHGLNAAAPWLQNAQHVRAAGWIPAGRTRNEIDPYPRAFYGEATDDEGGVVLEHRRYSFSDGTVLMFKGLKPAFFSCRPNLPGVDFGAQEGLALNDDEAPVEPEYLIAAGLVEYWDRFSGNMPNGDPEQKAAEARLQRAAAEFDTSAMKFLRLPPTNFRDAPMLTGMSGRH